MRWFTSTVELRQFLSRDRRAQPSTDDGHDAKSRRVGLVPTMGALHEGHLSLIRRARRENRLVVVSIFVNPLQFAPSEDLGRYPRQPDADFDLCQQAGVDAVFAPSVEDLYGSAEQAQFTQVTPPLTMLKPLCGAARLGHFEGVATVVLKLFNIVSPQRAYFGRKDAQQLAILQRMVQDLSCPVTIVPCPTVRAADGLAVSSRNQYLTPQQRQDATAIYGSLQAAEQQFSRGVKTREPLLAAARAVVEAVASLEPEYIELVHPRTLEPLPEINPTGLLAIAARVGDTRLIDNVLLRDRRPVIAIDGPAGAGKSTVARRVAHQLELLYLDTGAMYRAVTWLVLETNTPPDDEAVIAELVRQSTIRLLSPQELGQPTQVWINNQDVTRDIRLTRVAEQVSAIAAQPAVRQELVKQQQYYGRDGGIVLDGRDIGTHVFPDAEVKIFLTASVQERARRRQADLQRQGQLNLSLEDIEQSIYQRDRKDSTRAIAPLRKAADAIEIQTDALSIDQVVEAIVDLYCQQTE
ncbi:MAG: bifunctional pantoate--beta-alanine ligase/(d)CMP kinase [Cyanobacteria bacterium P01_A01_bin.135]